MTQWVIEGEQTPAPAAPPPLEQEAAVGAAYGAAGGLAFLGWESAILGWLGLAPAVGAEPVTVVALYVVTGALLGALASLTRPSRAGWALMTILLALAWLVSGHLGTLMREAGGGAWMALPFVFALAWLAGVGLVGSFTEATVAGIAVGLFLCLAGLLPVNMHLLVSPLSPIGLLINGAILLLATILGGLAAMVFVDGVLRVPGLLGVAVVVGWLAAVPVLRPVSDAWPVGDGEAGPPLVLVVVDGLRPDHLGIYGYPRPTSPRVDTAASQRGIVYAEAGAASSWTLPATASLLTGRIPSHHGAGLNPPGRSRLVGLDNVPTLAERLADEGYTTAGIASSPLLTRAFGFRRGFDAYDDRAGPGFAPAALHPWWALGLQPFPWPDHREAEAITRRALDFMAVQPPGSSWFLMVHYMDLLDPDEPLPEDAALAVGVEDPAVARYDAAIHRVDREIGRLLDAVPSETWVVVTADHGLEVGDARPLDGSAPAGVRSGHHLFQELLHVPLVVIGPGVEPRWVERPVPAVDVAPTLMALGGAALPRGLDGEPLPEVVGSGTPTERVIVAEAIHFGPEMKSARRGRYKVIVGPEETRLYDLELDPHETSPIREADRDRQIVVRELLRVLPRAE